ncbi:Arsenite efflux transporter ArsB-like, puative [Taphrina deformans PYCC 5710]|uniref:Arsenite efflux transporter ArsB-like, puative n=1 Tax=Taphrina deformans (strain PYCC 5710 / ATCC 11124 / CBS 356.35 / IMI 108563 / JCM 9778 / NBRC 8474) TaxID=1097556 RepID=R4XFI1_TAPDE|nr:Arsenite efflux transporter ArsB-like, puative [Taphrina deformans PYCC 5710]|eukprot:CCG83232.1 Arsenite efflux transporter ArsB-like, puative [Taphrina deformans PYCC 5710]
MENNNKYDAKSIVTLIFFVISIFFILCPVRIPRTRLSLNLATAPPLCVLILLASTCIPIQVVWDGIRGTDGVKPYNILILFFGLAYMSISLDMTGVLQAAAFWISNKGGKSGYRLYTYFFLMSLSLAVILGNDPVILSGTAFLVYFTKVAEVDPLAFLIAEFASCNIGSMVLFVGNPTNVVLCEGFGLGYLAFSAWTLLPFVACALAAYITLLVLFRKHVPKIIIAPELNPKEVLNDAFGAKVGSFLILACLITIIGVSFVGVDVWEIALPFALFKALFDIAWDYYRFRKDKLPAELIKLASPTMAHVQVNSEKGTAVKLGLHHRMLRKIAMTYQHYRRKSPVFITTLERLPFPLLSFTFSQFMLVEALVYRGWTHTFAAWLSHLTTSVPATVFSVGFISIILCGVAGTNILSTILLTKILQQYATPLDDKTMRAASIALAVGSNIGAVSVVFSASLAGLLWQGILKQKGLPMSNKSFAKWNSWILLILSVVGFAVVYAEIEVYFGSIAYS